MKIHEYQAKEILAKYGVAVPRGEMAATYDEAVDVAKRLFAGGASGYPAPDRWAKTTAPFLLKISSADNGSPLTAPGAS